MLMDGGGQGEVKSMELWGMGLEEVCVYVSVCDAQIFIQIHSVHHNTPPLYSNVRTAAMFGFSPPRGLSSLSAQHKDYM